MSRSFSILLISFALFNIINCASIVNTGNAIEFVNENSELKWEEMEKSGSYTALKYVFGKRVDGK